METKDIKLIMELIGNMKIGELKDNLSGNLRKVERIKKVHFDYTKERKR